MCIFMEQLQKVKFYWWQVHQEQLNKQVGLLVFGLHNQHENPFENQIQDISMTVLCNTIERDLKEMINEPMPEKIKELNGYLY